MKRLKPSECYYGIDRDVDEYYILIVEKKFWHKEGNIGDWIEVELPKEFEQYTESTFYYFSDIKNNIIGDLDEAIKILEELGFTYLKEIDFR